jgi:hypothetical protein
VQGDLWMALSNLPLKRPVSIHSETQQPIYLLKAVGWQNIATIMIATESIKSHNRKRAQPGKIFPKSTKDSFQFTDIKTLFV